LKERGLWLQVGTKETHEGAWLRASLVVTSRGKTKERERDEAG